MKITNHQMYKHIVFVSMIMIIILTSCSGSPPSTSTQAPSLNPTAMRTPTAYIPALQGTPVYPAREELSAANADQIVQLAKWGKGVAIWTKYSPDGRYLAISSRIGVYLFDAGSYELISSYEPGRMGSADIAFFPDGRSLMVTTEESVDVLLIPELDLKQKSIGKPGKLRFLPMES
ncbi:MAG: PD40 domain-containing protein [Anaerolineaceae bacterium]|nr:PD40 domain-containing protein [Anaerolineaceae bacterium]